jgi:uncharacterized protein (TIGR03382 family)
MKRLGLTFALCLLTSSAGAQIVVDGTRDALYGGALSVQRVETGFGDANPDNGSELDAGYAYCDATTLYLMFTGNIEANFNKLEIFIDSKAGGQSVFDSAGNDGAAAMDGMLFDVGFTANYHLIARRGNDMGNDKFDLDFADLGAQTFTSYSDVLGGLTGSGSTGTGVNATAIGVGYDNSNVLGVIGGSNAADQTAAAAVTTGLELSISLADLGYTGGAIKVMVGQNNQGHNYWSNQFLGGLAAPQGNLGGDGAGGFTGAGNINLQNFAGDQFFTACVPEPTTLGLAGLALAALVRRRK